MHRGRVGYIITGWSKKR